ncbi:tetratricopeptide repeat protein [Flavobacteriaceae bacterium]|nr:tetratricopeptide repeat protein [Flavobacteriaceae bacterium]
MNFCGDCGNKLNSDDKFCAKCGVGLQKETIDQKLTIEKGKKDLQEIVQFDFDKFKSLQEEPKKEEYDQLYSEGISHYEDGDYKSAVKAFTKAIDIYPDNPEGYGNRGLSYYNLDEYKNALNDFEKSIDLLDFDNKGRLLLSGINYNILDTLSFISKSKFFLNNYKGAIATHNEIIRIFDERENDDWEYLGETYYDRSICNEKLNRPDNAIDDLKQSLKNHYLKASINLKILLDSRFNERFKKENYEEAILDLDYLIKFNSDNKDYHFNRGICNNKLKSFKEAIDDFDKVIELDPSDAGAYFNRGISKSQFYGEDDPVKGVEEAKKDLLVAKKLDPNHSENNQLLDQFDNHKNEVSNDNIEGDKQLSTENIANELLEKASIDNFVEYKIDPWAVDWFKVTNQYIIDNDKLKSHFESLSKNEKEVEGIHFLRDLQFRCFGKKHFLDDDSIWRQGWGINFLIEQILKKIANDDESVDAINDKALELDSKVKSFKEKFNLFKEDVDAGKMNQFKEEFFLLKSFYSYMYFMIGFSLQIIDNVDSSIKFDNYTLNHLVGENNHKAKIHYFYFAIADELGDIDLLNKGAY